MTPQCAADLDRYRRIWNRSETLRTMVEAVKAKLREHLDKVSELDAARRLARVRYQQLLKQSTGGLDSDTALAAKQELASAEANLAEAQGVLQGLEAELPSLKAQMPSAGDLDAARRAAWEAIWMDLRSQVPKEIQHLVAQTYAALLEYRNDAAYATALAGLFMEPPTRQQCTQLIEQLAKDYSIPS